MRILIIQLVPPSASRPQFRHELGVAAALLAGDGFQLALTALGGYDEPALRDAVNRHRPTHVLIDIPPGRVTAARHTIVDVSEKLFLPVVAVGPLATCQPDQAISIPTVAAIVRGEYPRPLLALFRSIRDGVGGGEDTAGVWLNTEEGLIRNEPAPLVEDLDALPFPDREIFCYQQAVASTGEAHFYATQGCPQWCGYCLNDWYMELYRRRDGFLRRRSVGNVVEEIARVTARYAAARRVVFCDHGFAADAEWLGAFAARYAPACPLPLRCHLRLNAVNERTAELLVQCRCDEVDVEIGSGSNFIRAEILAMRTDQRQILDAVAALRRAGLRIRASVFLGAPYESEVSVDETLDLLCRLSLDEVRPRVYYPLPGTRAAEICAENGWISGRGEENFFAGRSVLDMPSLAGDRIDDIAQHFQTLLKRRGGRTLRGRLAAIRRLATTPLRVFRRRRR